jgi:predicted dehydrogenase
MYKVAVIGAGFMASEHMKCWADVAEARVVGIYSRSRESAARLANEFNIPLVFDSVASLYQGTRADLVLVAVSESATLEICTEISQFPWTALIEKPVGIDAYESQKITSLFKLHGVEAYVALNRRFYSSTRYVKSEIGEEIGPIVVQIFDQQDPLVALKQGRPKRVVENWMFANSIHLVDYFFNFCRGDILDVVPSRRWKNGDGMFVSAEVIFSSGDIGIYHAFWNMPAPWAVIVNSLENRWEIRPLELVSVQKRGSRVSEPLSTDVRDEIFKPGLRVQCDELIKAVSGQSHALVSLEENMKTVRLIEKIYDA